jgi:poly-gamma-glutamate biosynthesis protein PgsC/CapC
VTGLPPEVSVLLIALGLVLALACYLATNLSPGGMITPGWLALVLIVQPLLALVIGAVVVITYLLCRGLERIVILYGKRLFATVVLVSVFFQITFFLFLVNSSPLFFDVTTLGFIVPGLVAYQLMRQPAIATLVATATVTMVAYSVMLAGILLRLVPTEGRTAAGGIAAEPAAAFSSLQLALSAAGVALILAIVGVHTRRVSRTPAPVPIPHHGSGRAFSPRPEHPEARVPASEEEAEEERQPVLALARAEAQG